MAGAEELLDEVFDELDFSEPPDFSDELDLSDELDEDDSELLLELPDPEPLDLLAASRLSLR